MPPARSVGTAAKWLALLLCACESNSGGGPHPVPIPPAPAPFVATDLGSGECYALSPDGGVLGADGASGPFVVNAAGQREALGQVPAGATIAPLAVNARGTVVGMQHDAMGRRAVVYRDGAWS